jgi:hypothetical protein
MRIPCLLALVRLLFPPMLARHVVVLRLLQDNKFGTETFRSLVSRTRDPRIQFRGVARFGSAKKNRAVNPLLQ